ncbi:hypothetical protein LMG29739_04397 [Paraburkholderia solisilvae]|uniref:Uncharacterized protein n=1 Tax=Paraburkholderia solisilvae TaxID=624376 RepID=A0A6J5EG19_9BURK|nr:hypothetical protein LMG29739_04397 [Paraburkholderia solisilvae]
MPERDVVAVSILRAAQAPGRACAIDVSLHRPEPNEPPGPDQPDEDDDAPPDPERLPGEPTPLPIGDPPPDHAPQSADMLTSATVDAIRYATHCGPIARLMRVHSPRAFAGPVGRVLSRRVMFIPRPPQALRVSII